MRIRVLLVLLICLIACACAQAEAAFELGGRGEDVLYEAVCAQDGLFAVGKTASTDGDLAARKRAGETGWAIFVDEQGVRKWDFCSARSGMYEMIAPRAYEDGRFALILTDETRQRGDFIVLDARGRQETRTAIPDMRALGAQDGAAKIIAMRPQQGANGPYLMLLLEREGSGELFGAALTPEGGVYACGAFYGDAQGVLVSAHDHAVHVGVDLGALAVTHLAPGSPLETHTIALAVRQMGITVVTDALVDGDGSLLIGAQATDVMGQSEGLLLRLNAEGDLLFARSFGAGERLSLLTETESGYAAYAQAAGCVVFLDEDGEVQGVSEPVSGILDLMEREGGALALTKAGDRFSRQAVFTPVYPSQTADAIHTQALPINQKPIFAFASSSQTRDTFTLSCGTLRCEDGGAQGVTITLEDEAGSVLWRSRTPIHTAADRLVWENASVDAHGEIVLAGYYETQMQGDTIRERAQARLSVDGVLLSIGLIQ